MNRYSPSRGYFTASLIALALGAFSIWFAADWAPAWLAVGLFLLSTLALLFLALRPTITVGPEALVIGRKRIPWTAIRRVDRTGWISPLVVHLTLANNARVLVFYPGDLDASNSLLRQLRQRSVNALIDGIPYRTFWGEEEPAAEPAKKLPAPIPRLLRAEDEAEVKRLYQRLKKVGRLDSTNTQDES